MGWRVLISRLASVETRAAAARALAVGCGVGALLTLLALAAAGAGLEQWFFVLLVWMLFVYLPLRIFLEASQSFAPALRRRLAAQTAGDEHRYHSRASIELVVDRLLEQLVLMPRIATPAQTAKARDGAVAVLSQAGTADGPLQAVTDAALGSVDRWVTHVGTWAARDAGQNIQARWSEVRALAALAALTRVLLAARQDRTGRAEWNAVAAGYLEACLDYCDELALDVDVKPWREPALRLPVRAERAEKIRTTWKTFCETGAPALEARQAFLDALFTAVPPERSTAS